MLLLHQHAQGFVLCSEGQCCSLDHQTGCHACVAAHPYLMSGDMLQLLLDTSKGQMSQQLDEDACVASHGTVSQQRGSY